MANTKGAGDAGDIKINPFNNQNLRVSLQENSKISVEENSQGNQSAGDVQLTAASLSLDNSRIIAETISKEGGNIKLNLSDRLNLSNNSTISARARNNAQGGNVEIDAQFIIAAPEQNNDILANASKGRGGKITIDTEGIFGIQERKSTPPNSTNDLDASSEVTGNSGNVSINTPDINLIKKIVDVPSKIVSADIIAANVCSINQETKNTFIVNNRGGIPHQPTESLTTDILQLPQPTSTISNNNSQPSQQLNPIVLASGAIYPAKGVIIQADGTITLTAYKTDYQALRLPSKVTTCK